MARLQLDEVYAAMERMGISWDAGETEVSSYLDEDVDDFGLFGLSISEDERRSMLAEAKTSESRKLLALAPPPSSIDWRDFRNANWVTPVGNQGGCGSCMAFATCACLEARTQIDNRDPDLGIDLSEAHLFFCGAGKGCQKGWNFQPALQFCRDTGVGDAADFPYEPRNQNCKDIPPVVHVTGWDQEASETARKQAISANGPVVGGMRVFEDFYYYRGGVYRHATGSFRGLHAVCIVGYSDPEECWIVKNSWGTGWGENGFFRIGYGQCGLDSEFPFYDPFVSYSPRGGESGKEVA